MMREKVQICQWTADGGVEIGTGPKSIHTSRGMLVNDEIMPVVRTLRVNRFHCLIKNMEATVGGVE